MKTVLLIVLMFVSACASAQIHLEGASMDNILSTLSDNNVILKRCIYWENVKISKNNILIQGTKYSIDRFSLERTNFKEVNIEAGSCSVLIIFATDLIAVAAIVKQGSETKRYYFNQNFFSNE